MMPLTMSVKRASEMAGDPRIYLLASDDPLLKNERSETITTRARKALPDAELLIFTSSDFQAQGRAGFAAVETELVSPGLFGGNRILKIYLRAFDLTAAKLMLLVAEHMREGVYIIFDLPRIVSSYAKLKPKPLQAKIKGSSLKTLSENAVAFLKNLGASVEILYPPEGTQLRAWVAARAARYKMHATADAVEFVAASCEGNLQSIDQTFQVLGFFMADHTLTAEFIENYLTSDCRSTDTELAECILAQDAVRALNILSSLCPPENRNPENLGRILARLDSVFSLIPLIKKERPDRMDFRRRLAFFAKTTVKFPPLQTAAMQAAPGMPQWFFAGISAELAKACTFYSAFKNEDAFRCLQNICMAVKDFQILKFSPPCETALP